MDKKTELKERVLLPIIDAGFGAWFVGGCVRDSILGKTPHDFDICTDATPEDLHKVFKNFSNVSNNSEEFGVTMPLIAFSDDTIEEVARKMEEHHISGLPVIDDENKVIGSITTAHLSNLLKYQ